MRVILASSLLLSLGASLTACSDDPTPPTPTEVRAALDRDLTHVIAQTADAADGVGAHLPVTSTSRASLVRAVLAHAQQLEAGAFIQRALPPAVLAHLDAIQAFATAPLPAGAPATVPTGATAIAPEDPAPAFDAAEVARWLDQHVFTDANELSRGIYTIPTSALCDAGDTACAAAVTAAKPRVRVERGDGGVLLAYLQIGDAGHEPLAFTLSGTSASVTLDLDHADAAFVQLVTQDPDLGTATLAGQLSARVELTGDRAARVALTVDRDLALAWGEGQALHAGHLDVAKSDALAIQLDGATGSGVAALALGAIDAGIADDDASTWSLALPAATATIAEIPTQPLMFQSVSLGQGLTVKHAGALALAVTLNEHAGRTLAGELAQRGQDVIATIPTGLDLAITLNHDALGDTRDVFDVTEVTLAGGARPAVALRDDGSLRVEAGALAIATDPAEFGVRVAAGECAREIAVDDAQRGVSYLQWQQVTCVDTRQ